MVSTQYKTVMKYNKQQLVASIYSITLFGLLLGYSPSSLTVELSEDYYFDELPVVLSVSRLEQPLIESASSVTIIDREMIETSGARQVAELFRLVPGFQVGFERGSEAVVAYHGLSDSFSRRLQVLINGRAVYTPSLGGAPWSNLDLSVDDIDRIEVIRGPNAALYGSNSFNAIISITTRNKAQSNSSAFITRIGDRDTEDLYLNYNGQTEKLQYNFKLETRQNSGFELQNDDKDTEIFSTYFGIELTPQNLLTIEAGHAESTSGDGIIGNLLSPARDVEDTNAYTRFEWELTSNKGDSLSLQYYYNLNETVDRYNVDIDLARFGLPLQETLAIDSSIKAERQDIEIEYTPHTTGNTRYVFGASTRLDELVSPGIFSESSSQTLRQHRLFANVETKFNEQLILNAGAMLEDNTFTDTDVSPKLSLIYKLSDTRSLRVTGARAFRTPLLIEEQSNVNFELSLDPPFDIFNQTPFIVSSGNLEPEQITAYEISYQAYDSGTNSNFSIKLFRESVKDLISRVEIDFPEGMPTLIPTVIDLRNTDNALSRGIEVGWDKKFNNDTRLTMSYAHINISSNNLAAQYDRSAPRDTFSLLFSKQVKPQTRISFDLYHQSKIRWLDSRDQFRTNKLDLQLQHKFNIQNLNAYFELVIENLIGDYRDYREENITEPGGFIEFGIEF